MPWKENKANLFFYQNIIDEWRKECNTIRPCEALNYKTPSEVYSPVLPMS